MRPKVVATILLLAFGALGVVVLISRVFHHEEGREAAGNLPVAQAETALPPEKAFTASVPLAVASDKATVAIPPVIQEENHADYVRERIAELMELAMNDDSDSLNTIWAELSNPDKEIRQGALEAVVQFGDRSVVPRLRELAAQTEDPAEAASILAAADHLDLPPLGEPHGTQ
jgi:hypothetical protein